MKLISYPNVLLDTKCESVTEFNEELGKTLDEMKNIMLQHNGIGLSANQVGITKSMFVMQNNKKEIFEIINPKILEVAGLIDMSEGCLSAKDIFLNIIRPESVMFQYQDRNGEIKKAMAEGIEARCIQHEIEHLNGIFYFSKVNRQARKILKSKLKKNKV
jgi:peptide deformylase